jgi:hypothetical protein
MVTEDESLYDLASGDETMEFEEHKHSCKVMKEI